VTWPPVYSKDRLEENEPYWCRREETMPAREREALVLAKLQAQIAYAWERSPFYREKWQAAGFQPERLGTLADLARIPVLTKDELRREQEAHPPFGRYLCADPRALVRMHGTSGTTGKPTIFAIDEGDWARIGFAHARIMWGFGVRPRDTVFIGSLFSLYVGSWGALAGTERLGATAFPFGAGTPGQTERAVAWIARVKPTVFYGTPSYALYLAEAARKLGVDPKDDFAFRILFFSGEPGAGVPATRRRIEETFGGICVDTGSMAEMTPWMTNGECAERSGMHLWQDIVYTELVGKDSGERVPYGEEGVPVYTHLERTSQPMIRYWSGDLARWTDEPCRCGRSYPRLPLGIYGRADDMFIVRGVNIYPTVVENVLRAFPALGEEFRIVISREEEMDTLLLQVEPALPLSAEDEASLLREVEAALRKAIGVAARLALLPAGSLERTEFKARRTLDKRELYAELKDPFR
jgi:phenylacetate-CoA ligase